MSSRTIFLVLFLAAVAAVAAWPRRGAHPVAPQGAKRIVSLVPSATEILFDIGAGDRVVGVTTWCRWPPEARTRTIVGDFASPNVERIMALKPDVVVEAASHPDTLQKIRSAGLPVEEIRVLTLADTLDQYNVLGRAAGLPEAAAAARARLEQAMSAEEARWKTAKRVKIALVIGRDEHAAQDIYVAGGKSFLSELAVRAGAENVFADIAREFEKVSPEQFILRAPDVILELNSVRPPTDAEALAAWAKLGDIPAVREKRVRVLSQDYILQPGPRMALTIRALGEALR